MVCMHKYRCDPNRPVDTRRWKNNKKQLGNVWVSFLQSQIWHVISERINKDNIIFLKLVRWVGNGVPVRYVMRRWGTFGCTTWFVCTKGMSASGTECSNLTPLLMNSGVTGKQLIMTTDMADFQDVSSISFCWIIFHDSVSIMPLHPPKTDVKHVTFFKYQLSLSKNYTLFLPEESLKTQMNQWVSNQRTIPYVVIAI